MCLFFISLLEIVVRSVMGFNFLKIGESLGLFGFKFGR